MENAPRDAWKGAAAGLAAGLAATWVMTRFQTLSGKLAEELAADDGDRQAQAAKAKQTQQREQADDNATVKAADKVSRQLRGHPLSRQEKKAAGPAVHYGFGTLTGVAYGVLAELAPEVTRGAGAPFGTAVWLGADEVAVPAFGLSKAPWEYPASVHARALAAHLVYGVTAEGVRRLVRQAL